MHSRVKLRDTKIQNRVQLRETCGVRRSHYATLTCAVAFWQRVRDLGGESDGCCVKLRDTWDHYSV